MLPHLSNGGATLYRSSMQSNVLGRGYVYVHVQLTLDQNMKLKMNDMVKIVHFIFY